MLNMRLKAFHFQNLLKACVVLLLSAWRGGAFSLIFLGSLTVVLVVAAFPTLSWKELTEPAFNTPPLQQSATCWLKGTPGSKSTMVGFFIQECGMLPLNLEQSPSSVACAPIMFQITSFRACAHDQPNSQPGAFGSFWLSQQPVSRFTPLLIGLAQSRERCLLHSHQGSSSLHPIWLWCSRMHLQLV